MRNNLRNGARIAAVCALVLGVMPFAHADSVRADTNLAGFAVEVQASPVLVLLDDPNAAIPRPTGTAVIEGDPNFTLASVSTGPNAHAIASTLWPGNLFGEGLPQIDPRIPPYPLKAESRYPDKPYTAQGVDGGALTNSSALGLDAFAQADGTPTNKPGVVTIGSVTSSSSATVTDKDVALGTAVSALHDVNLIGGLIHIGSVTTHLTASADGKAPSTTGSTTVEGLTIAGQSFTVDDTGVHAGPQNSPLPELASPEDLKKTLGVSISGIVQTSSRTGSGASRSAAGLVIRIDTVALKTALAPVLAPVKTVYNSLIDQYIPPSSGQQGNFYYLMNATPSVTFVFGQGSTHAAATLPITFEFPPPPDFPSGPELGSGELPSAGTPQAPELGLPSVVSPPTVVAPVLQPPGAATPVAFKDTRFGGISAGLLLGALLVSGLVGWGLLRFLGLAGGLIGFGCRLGAPTSVPNLRSVSA